MKSVHMAWLRAACVLLLSGCGGGADQTPENDTTATLLSQPAGDGRSTPVAVDPSMASEGPRVPIGSLGFNRGDGEAIVKVLEMSDFGCGYCKRFHDETFPLLRDEFIETGMVEWKFVPYITGMFANSLAATEAGECVMEQGADPYERMTSRMWTDQGAWKNVSEPDPVLRGWASEIGVDIEEYDACLTEDRRLQRVASATTLAAQLGVRGTPTFIVIGYPPLQGALPVEMFREVLNAVHAEELRQRSENPPSPN